MPANQLAPPVIPGLFMPNIGAPNQMAPDPQAPGAANMPLQVNPMAPMSPADVYNYNAENLGDAWQAAQDPATWREAAQAYSQAMLAGSIGPEGKGFTAYHGSPHAFDQFDLSKIGTGEGAQAYGHGLYVADSEGVARSYRDQLAGKQSGVTVDGLPAEQSGLSPGAVQMAQMHLDGTSSLDALRATNEASLAKAQAGLAQNPDSQLNQMNADMAQRSLAALDELKGKNISYNPNPGHMYEVNVNADPAKFLDWDKPLSEQHPDVQAALGDSMDGPSDRSCQDVGRPDMTMLNKARRPISQPRCHQAGIPGIRYLDQGSRNAGGWHLTPPNETVSGKWMVKSNDYNSQGMHFDNEADARAALADKLGGQTRNSVVFDPATMNIIRRYGLAGLLGGGAAAATQQPSQ